MPHIAGRGVTSPDGELLLGTEGRTRYHYQRLVMKVFIDEELALI